MLFYAIRGAITVDDNTPQQILDNTTVLLKEIIRRNKIDYNEIISIIFTGTKDLDSIYPAVAARELGMVDIPLFCCQEMYVKGSLEKCIRVMMNIQSPHSRTIEHVYLKKAKSLRPDLIQEQISKIMSEQQFTVAIDGPAGAGKSTIAKALSSKLGIVYLDTGAMYRAVAYKMLSKNIDFFNTQEIIAALSSTEIEIKFDGDKQIVILDGQDVTHKIRCPEISKGASQVAVIPEVRIKLAKIQRDMAKSKSLVMDGRDIGTYVLPDATFKFYLTASLDERARRRWEELRLKGYKESIEAVKRDIEARDTNDKSRNFAPLVASEDAIIIDTTCKSIKEVLAEMLGHIENYFMNSKEG